MYYGILVIVRSSTLSAHGGVALTSQLLDFPTLASADLAYQALMKDLAQWKEPLPSVSVTITKLYS